MTKQIPPKTPSQVRLAVYCCKKTQNLCAKFSPMLVMYRPPKFGQCLTICLGVDCYATFKKINLRITPFKVQNTAAMIFLADSVWKQSLVSWKNLCLPNFIDCLFVSQVACFNQVLSPVTILIDNFVTIFLVIFEKA